MTKLRGGPTAISFLDRFPRRTLADGVCAHLRESLMCGEYAPGVRLTVREVAAHLGTSPMPVREAFLRLTSEGALEPLSNGATRVPVLDAARLQDVMDVRYLVEGLAARRAAERITPAELAEIRNANDAMLRAIRAKDARAEARANEHFHFGIYRAAGSPELLRLIEQLWLRVGPMLIVLLSARFQTPKVVGPDARHHRDILEALRRADGARAEAAVRADLSAASAFLVTQSQSALPAAASPR